MKNVKISKDKIKGILITVILIIMSMCNMVTVSAVTNSTLNIKGDRRGGVNVFNDSQDIFKNNNMLPNNTYGAKLSIENVSGDTIYLSLGKIKDNNDNEELLKQVKLTIDCGGVTVYDGWYGDESEYILSDLKILNNNMAELFVTTIYTPENPEGATAEVLNTTFNIEANSAPKIGKTEDKDDSNREIVRYNVICSTADGTKLMQGKFTGYNGDVISVAAPEIPGYTTENDSWSVRLDDNDNIVMFEYNPEFVEAVEETEEPIIKPTITPVSVPASNTINNIDAWRNAAVFCLIALGFVIVFGVLAFIFYRKMNYYKDMSKHVKHRVRDTVPVKDEFENMTYGDKEQAPSDETEMPEMEKTTEELSRDTEKEVEQTQKFNLFENNEGAIENDGSVIENDEDSIENDEVTKEE